MPGHSLQVKVLVLPLLLDLGGHTEEDGEDDGGANNEDEDNRKRLQNLSHILDFINFFPFHQ